MAEYTDIADAKTAKVAELISAYEQFIKGGVNVTLTNGTTYAIAGGDCNIMRMYVYVMGMKKDGIANGKLLDANGAQFTLTIALYEELLYKLLAQGRTTFETRLLAKLTAVNSASTITAVQAIVW